MWQIRAAQNLWFIGFMLNTNFLSSCNDPEVFSLVTRWWHPIILPDGLTWLYYQTVAPDYVTRWCNASQVWGSTLSCIWSLLQTEAGWQRGRSPSKVQGSGRTCPRSVVSGQFFRWRMDLSWTHRRAFENAWIADKPATQCAPVQCMTHLQKVDIWQNKATRCHPEELVWGEVEARDTFLFRRRQLLVSPVRCLVRICRRGFFFWKVPLHRRCPQCFLLGRAHLLILTDWPDVKSILGGTFYLTMCRTLLHSWLWKTCTAHSENRDLNTKSFDWWQL